jgi:antitoxin CptB
VPQGPQPHQGDRQDQGTDGPPRGVTTASMTATEEKDELLGERALSKLRWRCRRGLLENDLFLERFFERHGPNVTVAQAQALSQLMELGDHDLLDLQLARKTLEQVSPALDNAETRAVLNLLRENR